MPQALTLPLGSPFGAGTIVAGKYRIDRLIGEGGMGVVYEGFHLALEQRIAVKVVRSEYLHHPEAITRFLDEARAVARLRGPHIAHVLDTGRTETAAPYMVLEYLDGRDLRTLLDAEGPLTEARAVDYILQTCQAITEAHGLGIVHRDLKPENLFLTQGTDGRCLIKVIDFGISKRMDDGGRALTQHGQSLGSPHYMAPEQMSAPEQVDARADIWSLGVVLYELLTNVLPFGGATLPEACLQVLNAKPRQLRQLLPDVSSELERVVMRCLEKRKEDRFPNVEELATALSGLAVSSSAPSPTSAVAGLVPPVVTDNSERTLRSACEPPTSLRPRSVEVRTKRRFPVRLALGSAASVALLALISGVAPGLLREVANATSEPAAAHLAETAAPKQVPVVPAARPAIHSARAVHVGVSETSKPLAPAQGVEVLPQSERTTSLPPPRRSSSVKFKVASLPSARRIAPKLPPAPPATRGAPTGDISELMNPYSDKAPNVGRELPLAQRAIR